LTFEGAKRNIFFRVVCNSFIYLFIYLFIYAYNFLRFVVRQEQDACAYAEDQAKALSKEKEKLEEQIKVRKEPV